MSKFDDIGLSWAGESYTCKGSSVFLMLKHLEQAGIKILLLSSGPDEHLLHKCEAYSYALDFVGCEDVTPEDVYESIFLGEGGAVENFLVTLQMMIIPPSVIKKAENLDPSEVEPKKPSKPRKKPAK